MTAPALDLRPVVRRPVVPVTGLVLGAGVGVLLARPWVVGTHGGRAILFLTLGLVGVTWPLALADRRRSWALPLTMGIVAFGAGRLLVDAAPVGPGLALALSLNALAAVAEEAFFRRLAYGWLLRWGTAAALVGSAVLFAVAHVTVWGFAVLPLDLAAGLLLSWQRAVTGRWSVPAATHVVANALALL